MQMFVDAEYFRIFELKKRKVNVIRRKTTWISMNKIICLIQRTAAETLNHQSSAKTIHTPAKTRFFFNIDSNIKNIELNKYNNLEILKHCQTC